MTISQESRTARHIAVIEIQKSLNTLNLESEIQRMISNNISVVILDMRQCPTVNEAGRDSLIRSHKLLGSQGLRMFGLTPRVAEILIHRTQLDKVFKVFETQDEALADATASDT